MNSKEDYFRAYKFFEEKEITNMAKMSAINKNNRRIELSNRFYKKTTRERLIKL